MNGEIGVESEVNAGSIFWFSVPLAIQTGSSEKPDASLSDHDSQKILVVEDHHSTRDLLTQWLGRWGHRVEAASNGWEALSMLRTAALRRQPFGLAIVDQTVPEIDGLQLAGIMANEESLTEVGVILLSTLPGPSSHELTKLANLVECLPKPVTQTELREVVGRIVAPEVVETEVSSTRIPIPETLMSGRILLVEDNELNQEVVQGHSARDSAARPRWSKTVETRSSSSPRNHSTWS